MALVRGMPGCSEAGTTVVPCRTPGLKTGSYGYDIGWDNIGWDPG